MCPNDDLAAAQRGDENAFVRLFQPCEPKVYAIAYRIFEKNVEEARDAVCAVYDKTWAKVHDFRRECPFGAWVETIATNHCLTRKRDEGRRAQLLNQHGAEIAGAGGEVERDVVDRVFSDALLAAVQDHIRRAGWLPTDTKLFFWVKVMQKDYKSFAALHGKTANYWRSRLGDKMKALRVELRDRFAGEWDVLTGKDHE